MRVPRDKPLWFKSSFSAAQSNCVEVAVDVEVIGVRDTKARQAGALEVRGDAWKAFLERL